MESIINQNEIYMQTLIQEAVFNSSNKLSDVDIYNIVCEQIEISSLTTVMRVLYLIKLNKTAKIN